MEESDNLRLDNAYVNFHCLKISENSLVLKDKADHLEHLWGKMKSKCDQEEPLMIIVC